MKKSLTRLILGLVIAVGLTSPAAFAQLGYVQRNAPEQFVNYGDAVYYVCTYASTAANCSSNTVSIYYDKAGNSAITQTSGVALKSAANAVKFYASPGLYHVLYSSTVAATSYLDDILVGADFSSTTNGSTDWFWWVPATACGGATSGTADTGNATDIVATSGGARVFRLAATAASSSANTFTCVFNIPSRILSGKGVKITDITFLVSTQTTQPTSVTTPTLKSFTPPAAASSETASSATFSTFGGTITMTPTSAQFAGLAAVNAGQWYSLKASLGTPVYTNTDMQTFQFVIVFNQSASAASLQETPGFYVHGTYSPF